LSLFGQYTQDLKRKILNPDGLTDGIASPKKLIDDGLTQNGHPCCIFNRPFGKENAACHLPISNIGKILVVTINPSREFTYLKKGRITDYLGGAINQYESNDGFKAIQSSS
jgi:hypothetical protein